MTDRESRKPGAMGPSAYDPHADAYSGFVDAERLRPGSFYFRLVVPRLLEVAGPADGLRVLDAGCGEGTVTRLLAEQAREVVGVDICAPLLRIAQSRTSAPNVAYRHHDLTLPLSAELGSFDLTVSNLVLNDIEDFDAAIGSICPATAPEGRIAVSINSPYSAVMRDKVKSYFDSGEATVYRGLARKGVPVTYYHRTMEELISAFASRGWLVSGYSDVRPDEELVQQDPDFYERYLTTPFFTVLRFERHS